MGCNLGEGRIGEITIIISASELPSTQLEDDITTFLMIGGKTTLAGIVQNSSFTRSLVECTHGIGG